MRRSSHRPLSKENPEILEPEPIEPNSPEPEIAESVESGSPAPKRYGPRPAKLPLWDFLEDDARDSDGTVSVLYRLEPVISRRHKSHFIAQKTGKLTRQDILREFGSGVYDLYVKDVNKKLLYHDQLSLHHHQFPPQVNPDELIAGDPANEVYFKTWGKKSADGDKGDKGAAASDMNTVLNTVLDKAGAFDPKLAELWESTAQQRDELSKELAKKNAPPDVLATIKAIKDLLPALSAAPAPSSDKSEALAIIAALKGMQPNPPDPLAVMRQAKDLFAPAAATEQGHESPRNHIQELDQILGFAQKLAALRVNSGGRNGWDVGLDFVRELGPNIVQPTLQFISNLMVLNKQGGGIASGMAQPAGTSGAAPMPTFDPYSRSDLLRQHAQNLNRQTAPATAGPTPPGAPFNPYTATGDQLKQHAQAQNSPPAAAPHQTAVTPDGAAGMQQGASPPPTQGPAPANATLLPLLQNYGGLILNALNSGVPGYEFADNVARLFGNATHAMIANHGEQVLAENMLAIPELAMFGELRLRRFSNEFVNYEEFLDQEGVEDDDHSSTETNTRASGRQ